MSSNYNHLIADEKVKQEITDSIEKIEGYLVNSDQADDLISRILEGWTFDQCRDHVIYHILFLRWHLCASSAECNPERFFLSYIKEEIEGRENTEALYASLHPSLRYKRC